MLQLRPHISMSRLHRITIVVLSITLAACAAHVTLHAPSGATLHVPKAVASSVEGVPDGDKDYARADIAGATGEPGIGKIGVPIAVRLTQDMTVYRLWSG